MDSVIRAVVVYLFVWLIFRIAGKRTLSEMTTFDFVLLLIISEAIQQGMVGQDYSLTHALLLATTLVGMELVTTAIKSRWPSVERVMDDLPLVLVEDGKPIKDRMRKSRVDEQDILEAARMKRGLARMEQIRYAVLERSGGISIIPTETA